MVLFSPTDPESQSRVLTLEGMENEIDVFELVLLYLVSEVTIQSCPAISARSWLCLVDLLIPSQL